MPKLRISFAKSACHKKQNDHIACCLETTVIFINKFHAHTNAVGHFSAQLAQKIQTKRSKILVNQFE
jgi:hypothetical protein